MAAYAFYIMQMQNAYGLCISVKREKGMRGGGKGR